jgi:glycosyltransferase involved in cell wall biosynthesis
MRGPTLRELPAPPAGKIGWPWTEERVQLPDRTNDGREWPSISIVTPSYNQGQFIEETIRSVLLQGYSNLEYFVIDGGSNDESVEVIRKYEPWLTYWVSEPDRGQSNAINKGMKHATGEIVAWLNSDDDYLPGAFSRVAGAWSVGHTHWLVGKIKAGETLHSPDTKTLRLSSSSSFLEVAAFWLVRERNLRTFTQPEVFVSREAWEAVGGLFEPLDLVMDYHLWAKLSAVGYVPTYLAEEVAFFRNHGSQKTRPSDQNYHVGVLGERAWSLYDALRLARSANSQPSEMNEVERLLDAKAGGYCRVLDAYYSNSGWLKLWSRFAACSLLRPETTLKHTPRSIVRHLCVTSK